jgi:hypothetical protein
MVKSSVQAVEIELCFCSKQLWFLCSFLKASMEYSKQLVLNEVSPVGCLADGPSVKGAGASGGGLTAVS